MDNSITATPVKREKNSLSSLYEAVKTIIMYNGSSFEARNEEVRKLRVKAMGERGDTQTTLPRFEDFENEIRS
jgi:hypothetical protein